MKTKEEEEKLQCLCLDEVACIHPAKFTVANRRSGDVNYFKGRPAKYISNAAKTLDLPAALQLWQKNNKTKKREWAHGKEKKKKRHKSAILERSR